MKTMKMNGLWPAAALCALVPLSGCGNSLPGSVNKGSSGGASQWTTLGSREAPSKAGTTMTSNAGAQWVDYNPPAVYPGTVTTSNVFITMRDGVRLAANVTLPADADGNAIKDKFPAILIQTGYNKDAGAAVPALGGADSSIVQAGYAVVTVDTRGTGRSEGEWHSFDETEQADYVETTQWLRQQDWSDGTYGLQGASLLAITALLTAAQQPEGLKAVFAVVPMGDSYRDIVFQGGELNAGFIPLWMGLVTGLGLVDPTITTNPEEALQAALDHVMGAAVGFQVPTILQSVVGDPDKIYDGDFWKIRAPLDKAPQINVPVFVIGGLHCLFQRGEPLMYEALKDHVPSKLLIGPWNHVEAAEGKGLPQDGVPVFSHIELQWFDKYIKGKDSGADRMPNVTQYVYGYDHYVTSTDWPAPGASAQRWYLHGDQSLSTAAPAADEASNTVLQQPAGGICSQSASQWTGGLLALTGVTLPCFSDDSLANALETTYDSAPMAEDTYFNGPILADLWVSTTSQDAPVVVRIDDVDGSSSFALTTGIMQASFSNADKSRSRYLGGVMIEPWQAMTKASKVTVGSGNIVPVQVEIFPTSAMIAKGHKLRVSVGSSDLLHGVPPVPELLNELPGVMTIYSDAAHPSGVVFPMVPAAVLKPANAS